MKLKRIAGVLVLAPLLLLTACTSTPSLSLSANWYSDTNNYGGLTGTSEQLTYAVTFEATKDDSFRAEYDEGTYTTSLTYMNIPYAEGNPIGYYYETTLTITGRYYLNGNKGRDFTDTVTSKIWFLGVSDGLRPVRSEKYVESHTPNTAANNIEKAFTYYHYTYTSSYDTDLKTATVVFEDHEGKDGPVESKVSLSGSGTFLDNEQILFALRGLDLERGFTFRTINPLKRGNSANATVTSSESTATAYATSFRVNLGEEKGELLTRTVEAVSVTYGYNGNNPGRTQSCIFAKCVNPDENTYRNVMLHMETYALYSLGVFSYDLREANFNNK